MSPVFTALMIPFLGTALGSAFVFFMKRDMPAMLQKVLLIPQEMHLRERGERI